jgi:Protein of unknown function (DUF2961).
MRLKNILLPTLFVAIYGCVVKKSSHEIFNLSTLESRAASAENPRAEKGVGGMEKGGLKGSPAIKDLKAGATAILLDKKGPGMIRHIWCTVKPNRSFEIRNIIIRMYWENSNIPSVEVPLSDFFGIAHGAKTVMLSKMITVQPELGYNCYFPMPFKENAFITITNDSDSDLDWFFYQIDFTLGDKITRNDGRFHASFNRENPTKLGKDFTILETEGARGIYLGCVLGVRPLTSGWCGEGEVKMFIDDDTRYPTICGTGMEDYIGAAWGLKAHSALAQGAPLVEPGFLSMYRFHLDDPVYFQKKIKVTIQQMGITKKEDALKKYGDSLIFRHMEHPRRDSSQVFYLRSDDVCAVAYWYQYPLIRERKPLPDKKLRTVNLYKESGKGAIQADL